MNSKYQTILSSLLFLCIGLLIGWVLWNKPIEKAPANEMHGMMMDMTTGLAGKSGDDFDVVFLNEMMVHHQGAIDMANMALRGAKHQEIIDLSKNIIAAQSKEINDMRTWLKSWYGL